jgi:hypothetical protein
MLTIRYSLYMPVVMSWCDLRGAASGEMKRPKLMMPYSLQPAHMKLVVKTGIAMARDSSS